jgi:hypothetical protein
MKFVNLFPVIKRKMVKMLFIFMLSLSPSLLTFSNPIVYPPPIIELYFGPVCSFIELYFYNTYGQSNLNNMRITGLYDTAEFDHGIAFTPEVVLHVSQYDFDHPIYINPEGDQLHVELWYNGNWSHIESSFSFGPGLYSPVTAPNGEESIAVQVTQGEYSGYFLAKELPQTIGGYPNQIFKRGSFKGYVRDKNGEPMSGIWLDYGGCYYPYFSCYPEEPLIISGSDGYFGTNSMFCCNFYVNFRQDFPMGATLGNARVTIEPDSVNYYEFQLDTLLTEIEDNKNITPPFSISNNPNPSYAFTTFIIESNYLNSGIQGIIKIYNEAGYIIDIVPVVLDNGKKEVKYNFTDQSLASGLYIYSLEIKNQKVASGKMIIQQ